MNTFDILFKQQVEFRALLRMQDLGTARIIARQPPKSVDEIEQLAHQEAEHFYQSGKIFFLFKASWLGTQQQVTEAYYTAFVDGYKGTQAGESET